MKPQHFGSLEKAKMEIIPKDVEHISVWHKLSAGDEVELHSHDDVDEWLFINNGSFKVIVGDESSVFEKQDNRYLVFNFPRLVKHNLIAITDIYYFVVRM